MPDSGHYQNVYGCFAASTGNGIRLPGLSRSGASGLSCTNTVHNLIMRDCQQVCCLVYLTGAWRNRSAPALTILFVRKSFNVNPSSLYSAALCGYGRPFGIVSGGCLTCYLQRSTGAVGEYSNNVCPRQMPYHLITRLWRHYV